MPNSDGLIRLLPAFLLKELEKQTEIKSFIERFLRIFERQFADIEWKVEQIPKIFDPWMAEDKFLKYIASWLALELPDQWGEATRRALIDNITSIYNKRGTLDGLKLILSIYLGAAVKQIEEIGDQPHVFKVVVYFPHYDPAVLAQRIRAIRNLIDVEKPAHTDYQWDIEMPTLQIEKHSTIGKDTILGTI